LLNLEVELDKSLLALKEDIENVNDGKLLLLLPAKHEDSLVGDAVRQVNLLLQFLVIDPGTN